jgi:hypothetical protein
LTKALEILLALAEIFVNLVAIRQIESQRSKDLFQRDSREGFRDSLRRLAPQECIYDRIQRHARFAEEVRSGTLFDVVFCHWKLLIHYTGVVKCTHANDAGHLIGKIIVPSRTQMKSGICKLCLKEADLQQSHYHARALYRLFATCGEHTILASPHLIIQDQKQIKDYLLCSVCERRFNKMGENYAMQVLSRPGGFKILELVRASPMRRVEREYTVYSARDLRIEADKLAYFALSVLWRGAHIWPTFEGRATGGLQLGGHKEQLRRYLLGADQYPPGVAVKISVACDEASQDFATFPQLNPEQSDATVFTFVTRGIWFDIAIGDCLPTYMYQSCCVSSPEKPVFVGDFDRFVKFEIERSMQTARIGRNL